MIFCRIILGMAIYILSIILGVAVEPSLEVCFFNTGQGNCIALRSDVVNQNGVESRLIFIDCGCGVNQEKIYGGILSNSLEYPGGRLKKLFKGVSKCEIFVTHNHKDHENLVELIDEIGTSEECGGRYC
ncbi:MAG: hypothetical protein LBF34_03305, partial [Puniceicoccales bacterium]|nr:hypothetical protein [Puniceicoccales bacterium]